jgi:nucleotide-binding universal stress UspA family protein
VWSAGSAVNSRKSRGYGTFVGHRKLWPGSQRFSPQADETFAEGTSMRILLAVDGSKFSDAAAQSIVELRRPGETEVEVLHVLETPSLLVAREMGGYDQALGAAWDAEKRQAESLVTKIADLLRSKGFKATHVVEQGDPASKILDAARDWRADLVVIGSHGHKGIGRFLIGSVSEAIARHADCSVEIVRLAANRWRLHAVRVLAAIDDSRFSEATVNAIVGQMKPKGTEVTLLHVLGPVPRDLAESLGSKEMPDFTAARLKMRDEARECLGRMAEKLRSAGFDTSQAIEEGDTRDVILDYAERWGADLIAVGSHPRDVSPFPLGSVPEAVSLKSGCSVEIVRTRAAQ